MSDVSKDIECEDYFTPPGVCFSIIRDRGGFVNSEPFTTESYDTFREQMNKAISLRISKSMKQKYA